MVCFKFPFQNDKVLSYLNNYSGVLECPFSNEPYVCTFHTKKQQTNKTMSKHTILTYTDLSSTIGLPPKIDTHVYICTHAHTHTHVCMHTHTRHAHTCTHTHTHTHTFTRGGLETIGSVRSKRPRKGESRVV